ncbi:MAG: glucokinase [Rhodocyclaceae bacterium]|nr:glucokinase [Rhodocyclaceae bacterium]
MKRPTPQTFAALGSPLKGQETLGAAQRVSLIGDIGGTKVLLALVDDGGAIIQKRRLASADFSSFDALLDAYLREASAPVDGGCLAVAGPVADDGRRAKITNLPWVIDAARLEKDFGLGPLTLINDFAGVALGVTALAPEHLVTLQTGEPSADGIRLVLGAGTGLGMAMLVGDQVLPSEGGHAGFAPANETQLRLWTALQEEHGRVTAERVISGPGLAAIHRILTGEAADPAEIAERALNKDASARQTVDVFMGSYGAFAGDMALALMAKGGVFLAGGVTQKLLPLLHDGAFLAAFNAKAEHAELVRRMPVHVVTDPDIGLLGAATLARRTH